jgi:zeaxanthin epoxidase
VFLDHKQYFIPSDVGDGKMQWYTSQKEPAGGTDSENDECPG